MHRCYDSFCAFFYDQFTIDLRSICDQFASKRLMVSTQCPLKKSLCSLYLHLVLVWRFFDGVSMQVPWRIDVGFMEVSCRFRCFLCLNVMVAWRLLTDAVFMEVPCRFHGELMQISCSFHVRYGGDASIYTCWFYHALCLMQVPWRFHADSMQVRGSCHGG